MKIFFWLFLTALFCLLLAVQRVEERRTGIEVSDLENEVSLKESRNQYMRYRINVLTSPQNINKAAAEKLNMRLTPVKEIVVLKEDE